MPAQYVLQAIWKGRGILRIQIGNVGDHVDLFSHRHEGIRVGADGRHQEFVARRLILLPVVCKLLLVIAMGVSKRLPWPGWA